jgi:hypothetical protein
MATLKLEASAGFNERILLKEMTGSSCRYIEEKQRPEAKLRPVGFTGVYSRVF